MLPSTRMLWPLSTALEPTVMLPLTRVPLSVQVAPFGTLTSSTVTLPIVPRQVRSPAAADGAVATAAVRTSPEAARVERMRFMVACLSTSRACPCGRPR